MARRGLGGRLEVLSRDDAVDDAVVEGPPGVDGLSAEDHVEGTREAGGTGQGLGAASGGDVREVCFRQAKTSVFARDADVTEQGELTSGAEGVAVDGSNEGLREV